MSQQTESVLKTWNLGLLVYDKRNLVHVTSTTTVEEALFLLQRENILALPVYDEQKETFTHILTIFDILTYVAFGSFKIDEKEPDAYEVFKSAKIPISELVFKPIHSEDAKVWVYNANDKICKVLEPMCKGVHRILVDIHNGEGKPQYRMLTQSDMIRFLSSYTLFEPSSPDGTQKLKDLNIIRGNVKTANENTPALEAFRTLEIEDIMALPLVDDTGKLVATLSASDLRGLRSFQLKSILLSSIQFLLLFRGPAARRCVTCTENDTLFDIITKFIIFKVHRIWVVDANYHPVGVISLSDVIEKYVSY